MEGGEVNTPASHQGRVEERSAISVLRSLPPVMCCPLHVWRTHQDCDDSDMMNQQIISGSDEVKNKKVHLLLSSISLTGRTAE